MAPKRVLREYRAETYTVQIVGGDVSEVSLVSMTSSPEYVLAVTTRGYTGEYSTHPPSSTERQKLLEDIVKTKLATPTEMIHFTWLITGVTRAWTHQAVRYRVGTAFVQQSMRFLGYQDIYRVLCPLDSNDYGFDDFCYASYRGVKAYVDMKDLGIADQDARGVLPTNILTALFWDMSLSTLMHIVNTRWCCQAQTDEWLPVLKQMREQVYTASPEMAELITAPIERGEPCGFNASFDRPCMWKKR